MSKLDELIKKYCSDGVEKFKIKEMFDISRGVVISKQDIINKLGKYPVYSSQTENNGELGKINTYAFDGEYLTWTTDGANAGTVFYRSGKFNVTNVCGILKSNNKEVFAKYVYHSLKVEAPKYVRRGMGNPKLMSNVMGEISIPLPPLPVQEEIVRILDSLTEITAELTAELTVELIARKKQYEYYKNCLFTFEENVEMKTLGEIATLVRGNGLPKSDFAENGIGCIHYGQIYTYYGISTKTTKSFVLKETARRLKKVRYNDVVITNTSENIEDVCKAVIWEGNEDIVTGGHATIIKGLVIPKFFIYYTQTDEFFKKKKKVATGTKVIDVSANSLAKILIPIPSLEEQQRIVDVLDRFNTLCNDISSGLPAEIELRKKQYEYYRNKLFNFKEM